MTETWQIKPNKQKAWQNVGPDLGPNCLQRLSADDKSCCLQGKELDKIISIYHILPKKSTVHLLLKKIYANFLKTFRSRSAGSWLDPHHFCSGCVSSQKTFFYTFWAVIYNVWLGLLDHWYFVSWISSSVTQAWPIPYPLHSSPRGDECSGYGLGHVWITKDFWIFTLENLFNFLVSILFQNDYRLVSGSGIICYWVDRIFRWYNDVHSFPVSSVYPFTISYWQLND